MKVVGIIDFGLGNIFSVMQAFKSEGFETKLVKSLADTDGIMGLVLPGVGAFGQAMSELKVQGLDKVIKDWVGADKPLLGICLGLQLLFDESEEFGSHEGLGLVPGKVVKFSAEMIQKGVRIPHMGWSTTNFAKKHIALNGIEDKSDMYYVHSYYVVPKDASVELTWTEYGGVRYTSSVVKDNIWAFQFHPEKSAAAGMHIYKNWLKKIQQGI